MANKLIKKNLNIFLFYTIVSLTGIIILPTLGLIAPIFILCGIVTPIIGFIKLIAAIFKINIPIIILEVGTFTINPILGFLLSILIGIILYFLGTYAWKLLLKYIHVVSDIKKKI